MSRAVAAGIVTAARKSTHRSLIKSAANGEAPALVSQTTPLGATGLTLAGLLDTEIEVIADALKVADA